ncbi:MAG: hypothetical protein CVV18_08865, partial [Gammaproteobacteria bacterium HGW-Gammaproteobacteria-8]
MGAGDQVGGEGEDAGTRDSGPGTRDPEKPKLKSQSSQRMFASLWSRGPVVPCASKTPRHLDPLEAFNLVARFDIVV